MAIHSLWSNQENRNERRSDEGLSLWQQLHL